MHLKLPTTDSDFVIDSASISSFFSDNSDFQDGADSPIVDGDFSEYLWMENADEFDKEVMQQLEEEALMEECLEAMLDEDDDGELDLRNLTNSILESSQSWSDAVARASQCEQPSELCHLMGLLKMEEEKRGGLANYSTLNPNAAEFVPQQNKSNKPSH